MSIIKEPKVYVVGRQTIEDAELARFLADHGVSWQSDSSVAAEVVWPTVTLELTGKEKRIPMSSYRWRGEE